MPNLLRLLPVAVTATALLIPATPAAADRNTGGASAKSKRSSTSDRCTKRGNFGKRSPLERGDRGQDIRVLQDYLGRLGIEAAVDGIFGRQTLRAVKTWERSAGRKTNGKLPCRDIKALRRAVEGLPKEGDDGRYTQLAPGDRAKLTEDGLAVAPADAPQAVKDIIAAGNRIAHKPYRYGGGHGKWEDDGYDCSGSVSYALHGAGLLEHSMPSGGFTDWEESGKGKWVTVYANSGHMYMVVAGLRFDTSGRRESGTRWHKETRSSKNFKVRHPKGL